MKKYILTFIISGITGISVMAQSSDDKNNLVVIDILTLERKQCQTKPPYATEEECFKSPYQCYVKPTSEMDNNCITPYGTFNANKENISNSSSFNVIGRRIKEVSKK